jgi:hypothetical protein
LTKLSLFVLRGWYLGIVAGILAVLIWISPQAFFGAARRTNGFTPELFADSPVFYGLTVVARFARLAIIVRLS